MKTAIGMVIGLLFAISIMAANGLRTTATSDDLWVPGVLSIGSNPMPSMGLIRVSNTGSIVGFSNVDGTSKRANIISWDFPQTGNRIRIGPVADINGVIPAEQWGELEFYTDVQYRFNPDPAFQAKSFRYFENGGGTAFAILHNGNTPSYIRFGGGVSWNNEPNFATDQSTFVLVTMNRENGSVRNMSVGFQDTQAMKIEGGMWGADGVTASGLRVALSNRGVASQKVLDKLVGIRIDPMQNVENARPNYTVGLYVPDAATFGRTANYAAWIDGGTTRLDGPVEAAVESGYFRFGSTSQDTPPAADCDVDAERGRLIIDTTFNKLYICNGALRGWDFVELRD